MLFALDYALLFKIYVQDYYRQYSQEFYNNYVKEYYRIPCEKKDTASIEQVKIYYGNCHDDITDIFVRNQNADWKDIIEELQLDEHENYEIHITYEYHYNRYKIIYVRHEHPVIAFPDVIRQMTAPKTDDHRIFYSGYQNEEQDIDITNIIRELAGPNHDFYQFVNHHIRVNWIRNHNNQVIEDKIMIAESPDMTIHEFELGDILKLSS